MIENHVASISIDIAAKIHVTHITICHVPRAGINKGDSCFYGHLIAYNSVFNTVFEIGDQGPLIVGGTTGSGVEAELMDECVKGI